MRTIAALIAGMLIVTAGCTKESPSSKPFSRRIATGAISWSTAPDGEPKPGIEEAQILYVGDFAVFWSDLPSRTATSIAYGSEGDHIGGGGQFINADVGEIEFRYEINGRSSGTVVVAGDSYDLANGGLFLIAARQAPTHVLQVDCDLDKIELTEKELRSLARSNAEIAEFFGTTVETP